VILFELCGSENHPAYKALEVANGNRQYDFLRSIVGAGIDMQRPFLSQHLIKALNFQAITCLHVSAGEYRPCPVTVGPHTPPDHYRVEALMEDFVNTVNRVWERTDPAALAALVLWQLCWIHPFINGNGRTARAASYFVLCMKAGGWLRGAPILPELLRVHHAEYCAALRAADASIANGGGPLDLAELHALLSRLLEEQVNGAPPAAAPGEPILLPGPPAPSA
jgi:prophage maintenance system killer protein